jgi:hypothetical protein
MRVAVEREPVAQVLRIPAGLLETERAIVADEDLNAKVPSVVLE